MYAVLEKDMGHKGGQRRVHNASIVAAVVGKKACLRPNKFEW